MEAVQTKDNDLRDKIKTFLVKLDKMEERVKEVENISKALPRIESQLAKVISRVDEVAARVDMDKKPTPIASAPVKEKPVSTSSPTPIKALVSGASIGMLLIGAALAAWLLGLF